MVKCTKGKKILGKFRLFSALFWLLVPVLSYLYPRFAGHAHAYAWECFSIVNAGPTSWFTMRAELGLEATRLTLSTLAIAFIPFLVWLSIRGIGIKEWVFLVLWYVSGITLFYALGTL